MIHPHRLAVVAVILLAAIAGSAHADESRTWTDRTGKFRIEAEFVGEADGVVTLRKEDGEEIEVPLDKLSAADKRAVEEAKAAMEENPFESKAKGRTNEEGPFATKKKPAEGAAKGKSRSADRKSTRLNSSHIPLSRMPSSA